MTGDLIPQGLGPLRTRILEVALSKLGVSETHGPNRSPEIDKFLPKWAQKEPRPPWCCFFVCWVLKTSLGDMPTGVVRGNSLRLKEDAENAGLWKPKDQELPVPGDAFVMDVGEPGDDGHTGFVLRVSTDGTHVETCEANSGNRVRIGLRAVDDPQILGWVHTVNGERTDFYVRGLSGKGSPVKRSTR